MPARPLLAAALAALLATPAAAAERKPAARGPAKAAKTAPPEALSLGGWIGYESGDLDGLQLRFDAVMPYRKLSPDVGLSIVGSIGYSYLSDSVSVPGNTTDVTANLVKLVPAARFSFPLTPALALFGDAGLGLYLAFTSLDNSNALLADEDRTDLGLMLRLGGGALYRLNARTRLGATLALDPMFGGYDDVTFSFLAGLTYQP